MDLKYNNKSGINKTLNSSQTNLRQNYSLERVCKKLMLAKTLLDIKKIDTIYHHLNGRSIIISIIVSRKLPSLLSRFRDPQRLNIFGEYLSTKMFKSGENALHVACRANVCECIEPLLRYNCSLTTKNHMLLTPLQLAVSMAHLECIGAFVNYFRKNPAIMEQPIAALFNIYNISGHTIFHTAVQKGYYELVEEFLKVSQKRGDCICKKRELQCGQPAAQLALPRKDYKMIALLLRYDANACSYENYMGNDAYDMCPGLRCELEKFNNQQIKRENPPLQASPHRKSVLKSSRLNYPSNFTCK